MNDSWHKPELGVHELGQRLSNFLRTTIPRDRAKTLARIFQVSISTAQRWLDGKPPTVQQIAIMHRYWGNSLIKALFPEAFIEFERTIMPHHIHLARHFCPARECLLGRFDKGLGHKAPSKEK
jgi:hypothetical protein